MQDIFENFGVYIHVPFCARNCDYCKFYKRSPSPRDIRLYLDSIAEEVSLFLNEHPYQKIQTMFWGGGTPSCLSEKHILELSEILKPLAPSREWTVEVAPSTVSESKLKLLKDIGVNRISMGVQSFLEKTLKNLGRPHSIKSVELSIEKIAEQNFKNFGIDLIFGAPNQTSEEWLEDLQKASQLPVDHISAYCLEFESSTSCCGGIAKDDYAKLERDGDFFEATMDFLPKCGFTQYEISNFARLGCECLHNLSTWNMDSWVGFGPAAASQCFGMRFKNSSNFENWMRGVWNPKEKILEDALVLDDAEMFESALIFGLRTSRGVDIKALKKRFPSADEKKYFAQIEFLKEQKFLEVSESTVKLTRAGKMVADSVALELML